MEKFDLKKIETMLDSKELDITKRTILFYGGMAKLFYIKQLTDRAMLMENVIKPLTLHCTSVEKPVSAKLAMDTIIFADECRLESDSSKIEGSILAGLVVILFSTGKEYVVVNVKKVEQRRIMPPELTYTLRGPQDCLTENLDVNLSLIRYRVKDPALRIKKFEVGARTKANVAVIYIEDIANNTAVSEIIKRIEDINVDGIYESGELQAFLLNNKKQLFPQMGLVERSDMAAHTLVQGKVLVLVEGSGIGLLAPKTFSEFFYSCDDRYDNKFFGMFMRCIRYIGIMLAFVGSSLYVAIASFHPEVLPGAYVIDLANMRVQVPFNAFVAALILEFVMEMLRESLLRIPKQIGPAIGIVGAIVIGQAAIQAGIFSALLLIIVSTSLLASFVIPDYSLLNAFRILKFGLLIFTGLFGFFGFSLFVTFVIVELVSLNSFGVPYMAPWAPFNLYDFIRSLIQNSSTDPKRAEYLRTKDKTKTNTNTN